MLPYKFTKKHFFTSVKKKKIQKKINESLKYNLTVLFEFKLRKKMFASLKEKKTEKILNNFFFKQLIKRYT